MRKFALITAGFLAQGAALYALAADQPAPAATAAAAPVSREAAEFFEKNVRPVLAEKCYSCHGPKNQFAGLRVDSRAAMLKGSDKGAVVTPGDPAKSRLLSVLSHTGPVKMPPAGKLPDGAIASLTEWVKMGAPWPGADAAPAVQTMEQRISEMRAKFWSLQPVKRPALPKVKNAAWCRTPIDRFVLAKLEEKGLQPSKQADRRTLVRRAYFDLLGLPPTPQEISDFVTDTTPDAWEKLIDRLLASPQYGERWGRQWLDVARYSDTLGYLVQPAERRYPYAYTYRDYVIRAFNEDKPYNQFLLEQLAADQIELKDKRDLAALGFLTIGNRYLGNQQEIIDDRIDVVTRGLQGMTVGCARCHDHKYDPIPTADYYSLYGVFASCTEPGDLPQIGEAPDPKAAQEFQQKFDELKKREAQLRAEKKDGEAGNVAKQIQTLLIEHPGAPPRAMVINDGNPVKQRVFLRGNPGTPGAEVPRQYLIAVSGESRKPFQKGSGRLELAQTLVDPANPLTGRVMVNRIWMGHFGKGLVTTPSDFGVRGELPSHPELLDWLSATFTGGVPGAETGAPSQAQSSAGRGEAGQARPWSIKALHRLIMLSATYQQASDVEGFQAAAPAPVKAKGKAKPKSSPAARGGASRTLQTASPQAVDPENRLLWRMNRRRLDFEQVRDAMLRTTGKLDLAVGGHAVDIVGNVNATRRTLYGFIDRQDLPALYRTFDFADPNAHSPTRPTTTVPQQALFLMNSSFVQGQARNLAGASSVQAQKDDPSRVRQMYRLVYGRSPSADEVQLGLKFIQHVGASAATLEAETVAWRYGYGAYDSSAKKLSTYTPFPHFTGQAWQGGPALPDPKLGWATLNATGGHPGDASHSPVRRWTAPRDMVISISGQMRHSSDKGDGVEAVIVSSRTGLLGSWPVHNSAAETAVARVEVKRGDTLDFITSCRGEHSFDSFNWTPRIAMVSQTMPGGQTAWDAAGEFGGPPTAAAKPLSPWEAYAQALLMTNEFLFVD